jgi:hypothetical protein
MGVTHLSGLQVNGVPTIGTGGLLPFTGRYIFVDYYRGSDGNVGTADSPVQTLYQAHAMATDGNNDVIVIIPAPISTSSSNGTQRLSTAIAATIDPTATTGTLTWSKSATHLIGLGGPGLSNRCRIAPPSTYTAATFGATGMKLVNVTGQGCIFQNFSVYAGFSTNAANGHVAWQDAGGRNTYIGVAFLGINDTYSAGTSTNSRSLVVSGTTGENTFIGCTIGGDTTVKATANYSLELTGGSPRNKFIDCLFPSNVSAATASDVYVATTGIDRYVLFERCKFINETLGGVASSTITDVFSVQTAASGGVILVKDCTSVGHTGWSSQATVTLIDGAAPTNSSSGLAVAVSA